MSFPLLLASHSQSVKQVLPLASITFVWITRLENNKHIRDHLIRRTHLMATEMHPIQKTLSLFAAAGEGEVEAVLTLIGAQVDTLVGGDASAARALFLELERARSKGRTGGRANLSRIWSAVSRPSWHPESEGFLERALEARAGLVEPVPREVPELRDDDGVLIYDASSSTGFQPLWDQYRADVGAGKARSTLQKTQKLAGSLEAMYPAPAQPRKRRRRP